MFQAQELNHLTLSFLNFKDLTIVSLVSKYFLDLCRKKMPGKFCEEVREKTQNPNLTLKQLESLYKKTEYVEKYIFKADANDLNIKKTLLDLKASLVDRSFQRIDSACKQVKNAPEQQKLKTISKDVTLPLVTRNEAFHRYIEIIGQVKHSFLFESERWNKRKLELKNQKLEENKAVSKPNN